MRRLLTIVAAAALLGASGTQAASRPILRSTRVTPLTVVGLEFPRTVWIRVTASAGADSQTRTVRTSATGRFATAFAFRVNPCRTSALVVARRVGSSTELAQLRVSGGKCR